MFVCCCCMTECYVDEDGDIIECPGCDNSVGLEALFINDDIIMF